MIRLITVRPYWWLWWNPRAWREAKRYERFLNWELQRMITEKGSGTFITYQPVVKWPDKRMFN